MQFVELYQFTSSNSTATLYNMRGKKVQRGERGVRGKGHMLPPPTPPPPMEDSDSDREDSDSDSQQHVPIELASAQPTPSSKRKRISPPEQSNAVEMLLATLSEKQRIEENLCERLLNPEKRRAFGDFISSSLKDIDERLWDTYTHEALKLVLDFKRRSRAAPTVPGAPVAGAMSDEDDKDEQ